LDGSKQIDVTEIRKLWYISEYLGVQ